LPAPQPGKCGGKYSRFSAAKQFRLLAMGIRVAMMSPERPGLAFRSHLQEQPSQAEYKAFVLPGSAKSPSGADIAGHSAKLGNGHRMLGDSEASPLARAERRSRSRLHVWLAIVRCAPSTVSPDFKASFPIPSPDATLTQPKTHDPWHEVSSPVFRIKIDTL